MVKLISSLGVCISLNFQMGTSFGAEYLDEETSFDPFVAEASEEGLNAIRGFSVPEGFEVELIAAEPHLANPVAFDIDRHGHIYVVETFRHGAGVLDIRGRMGWPSALYKQSLPPERMAGLSSELLDMDLSMRSVDQRIGMLEHYFYEGADSLRIASDRIKKLVDQDGDGLVDISTVFAQGFNALEDGIAAGVLAHEGRVWFTNIPHLWELRDEDGDGQADRRRSVHQGFGVRTGFLGHDLHGLSLGPDARLYFSIGDRGARVPLKNGVLDYPDTGAVFRCELDGSNLEVFAYGLRNPQELAFDDFGNWFTGDNNSDGGDQARWVHLVEGGDSGWRIGFQFFEGEYRRGPWNAEKMWHPQWDEQAAFLIPPIANLGNGPSGLAYYPGTGLPDRYREHFFLADFRGGAGSGVHAFSLKPSGATFEIDQRDNFIWEVLVTDVGFGVQGGLYLSDWVSGWNKTGKGRLYRVYHPGEAREAMVGQVKHILAGGFEHLKDLEKYLFHEDRRVRMGAQFELANRGYEGVERLIEVAQRSNKIHARLHAIWGLGQVARHGNNTTESPARAAANALVALAHDKEVPVRAQVSRMLGEAGVGKAFGALIKNVFDGSARVQMEAMLALGKLGMVEAIPSILEVIRSERGTDPYLRHAATMAMVGIHDLDAIRAASKEDSSSVRMVSLLAMRRLGMNGIGYFLADEDALVVREAARAINDVPIRAARSDLALLIYTETRDEVIVRRSINANLREGKQENAMALASALAGGQLTESMVIEALDALGEWPSPSGRDRVTGVWNPVVQSTRDASIPRNAFELVWDALVTSTSDRVVEKATETALKLGIPGLEEKLLSLLSAVDRSVEVRTAALDGLDTIGGEGIQKALSDILSVETDPLKVRASKIALRIMPELVIDELDSLINEGRIADRQESISSLANLPEEKALPFAVRLLNEMVRHELPSELHLDVIQVAEGLGSPDVKLLLDQYRAQAFEGDEKMIPFKEVLYGGNRFRGRSLFMERVDLSCLRCHGVNGEGGQVGPELSEVGSQYDREYLLQSIIDPGAVIAPGYENVILQLENGVTYGGIIQEETGDRILLNSPEDGLVEVPKNQIKQRTISGSGMPSGLEELMSRQELRDLIEYLATRRGRSR